ncbi:unnamed protein product [Rotaria sp. Silwood1]|nr:unnamed protein product [Rotaria sp. Silwood1]
MRKKVIGDVAIASVVIVVIVVAVCSCLHRIFQHPTNYVLTHLPSSTDLITYWDYDAPHNSTIKYQPRDTSAAAIFASALVELSQYAPTSDLKDQFLTNAKAIVDQLSSPKYMIYGDKDYKLPALLTNGTMGPYPKNGYDVSLVYGDYYLTQAVIRLGKL